MPTIRYQIRNEYGLSDPDLHQLADKDDPEAILEGVAMAGLVGVLRQLGDLAEFAAKIFHDLHEEVTATGARGHGLMLRVQQLEAEFPLIEKAFLVQTNHSHFAYNDSIDWHANIRTDQNLVTQGDMPRFILDSYEECRGPPRLFMLDKFDVAGAGACLKRYSDPSFFKVEYASLGKMEEEMHREIKSAKARKNTHVKNGETMESFLAPLIKSNLQPDHVSAKVPSRRVKLKCRKLLDSDIANKKSYMEQFLEVYSPEEKVWPDNIVSHSPEIIKSIDSSQLIPEVYETIIETTDDSIIVREIDPTESPTKNEVTVEKYLKSIIEPEIETKDSQNGYAIEDRFRSDETKKSALGLLEVDLQRSFSSAESSPEHEYDECKPDDIESDLENYVDALHTIESEFEIDSDSKAIPNVNMELYTIDSNIYERRQEESTASREWNSMIELTLSNPVISGCDTQKNSEAESPRRTLDAVHDKAEVMEYVSSDHLLPNGASITNDTDGTSIELEVREESLESCVIDVTAGHIHENSHGIDENQLVTQIPDDTFSGCSVEDIHVVSQQSDHKAKELSDVANNPDTNSGELIPISEMGNLSLKKDIPDPIQHAEDVEENISGTENPNDIDEIHVQHVGESSLNVPANSGEQQESVKETKACLDGIVQPNDLIEETYSNDVKNSHEVNRDVDDLLPHAEATGFTELIWNSKYASDDLLFLSDTHGNKSTEVEPAIFNDVEMKPGNFHKEVFSEHVKESPLPNMQQETFPDQMEQANISCGDDTVQPDDIDEIIEERETLPPNISLHEKFSDANDPSAELITISSDDMKLRLNYSAKNAGIRDILMHDINQLESGHFVDVEEQESQEKHTRELDSLDSTNAIFSAEMQLLQNEQPSCILNSGADYLMRPLPSDSVNNVSLDGMPLLEEEPSCIYSDADNLKEQLPLDSLSEVSIEGMQVQKEESSCSVNSVADNLKEHFPLDSSNEASLDGMQVQNEEPCFFANTDAEIPEEHLKLDSANDTSPEGIQVQNEEPCHIANADAEILEEQLPLEPENDMQLVKSNDLVVTFNAEVLEGSPNAILAEQFPLGSSEGMFSDDMELQNKKSDCLGIDENEPIAGTMVGLSDGDFAKESYNDFLDEYVIVEADHNNQSSYSEYAATESGFDVHLQENYLPHDAFLNRHDLENLTSLVHDISEPLTYTSILSPELPIQQSDNTDKEGLMTSSSENVEHCSGVQELVDSHQESEHLVVSNENNLNQIISKNIVDQPYQPKLYIVDSNSENDEPDRTKKVKSEAYDVSSSNSEITGSLPIASTSRQDIDETPPLPPLPPIEWRLGNLRVGTQSSIGDTTQPTTTTDPLAKDENREQKSQILEGELDISSNPIQVVSHTEDGTSKHGPQKKPELAQLLPSLELERSQHEAKTVGQDPIIPINPFFLGSSEEWNHQYGFRFYGGESVQNPNMAPFGFLYPVVGDPSAIYNYMIPTIDGGKTNLKHRSIRDRPRDPLIEAVAAHDKSKLRKVSELDRPSVKPTANERDSLLEQIRNKSFDLKPANVKKPSFKGVPPTNLKLAAILEKANAIRQACVGSDEDEDDGDSWSDS